MKKLFFSIILISLMLFSCSTKEKIISPNTNPEHSSLYINEFMASNSTTIADENGDFDDWIEIYNDSDEAIDLAGYYLSDDEATPDKWAFPTDNPAATTIPSKGFLLIWADDEETQGPLHTNFKLSSGGESVILTDKNGSTELDAITYPAQTTDVSYGRSPDGGDSWQTFTNPTPGTSNTNTPPTDAILVINEFMASNDTTFADEHGEYDDWIELHNAGGKAIDIGGMYITDDLNELTKYQIPTTNPDSTTIQPGQFLLLWADKQPEQGILHLGDIKLSCGGEQIGIIKSDGSTIVDSLTFGEQTTDISYGRLPDGSDNWQFFDNPTPGKTNQ
jgi:hypothetical protein